MQTNNKCNTRYGEHLYCTIQSLLMSTCADKCPRENVDVKLQVFVSTGYDKHICGFCM